MKRRCPPSPTGISRRVLILIWSSICQHLPIVACWKSGAWEESGPTGSVRWWSLPWRLRSLSVGMPLPEPIGGRRSKQQMVGPSRMFKWAGNTRCWQETRISRRILPKSSTRLYTNRDTTVRIEIWRCVMSIALQRVFGPISGLGKRRGEQVTSRMDIAISAGPKH